MKDESGLHLDVIQNWPFNTHIWLIPWPTNYLVPGFIRGCLVVRAACKHVWYINEIHFLFICHERVLACDYSFLWRLHVLSCIWDDYDCGNVFLRQYTHTVGIVLYSLLHEVIDTGRQVACWKGSSCVGARSLNAARIHSGSDFSSRVPPS